ncbi:MAG: hypothetical protein U0U66_14875 [Cytophagaceae bacterium]
MKQYDIGIIINKSEENLNGSYGIIIEDYLKEYFLVEIWNFELFEGAIIDSLPKQCLRLATDEEIKEYKRKFKEYCDRNESPI